MTSLGVLFALTAEQDERILEAVDDTEVLELVEEIEERWDQPWLVELDKAWDALHRCLSDGALSSEGGEYPLAAAILGGEWRYDGDDYIVCYVSADEVRDVAEALGVVDDHWLRERYARLDFPDYQGVKSEDDLDYTAASLADLQDFYRRAAAAGRSVVFTVDQ